MHSPEAGRLRVLAAAAGSGTSLFEDSQSDGQGLRDGHLPPSTSRAAAPVRSLSREHSLVRRAAALRTEFAAAFDDQPGKLEPGRCEAFLKVLDGELLHAMLEECDGAATLERLPFEGLLGLARVCFVRLLRLDAGASQSALTLLRGLPEDAHVTVISMFDRQGARSGDLLTRLHSFAHGVTGRGAPPRSGSPERRWSPWERVLAGTEASPAWARLSDTESDGMVEAAMHFMDSLPGDIRSTVLQHFAQQDFPRRAAWCRRLGLDDSAILFLRALPEAVQLTVLRDFKPASTPEGSISEDFKYFAATVMARQATSRRAANAALAPNRPARGVPRRGQRTTRRPHTPVLGRSSDPEDLKALVGSEALAGSFDPAAPERPATFKLGPARLPEAIGERRNPRPRSGRDPRRVPCM